MNAVSDLIMHIGAASDSEKAAHTLCGLFFPRRDDGRNNPLAPWHPSHWPKWAHPAAAAKPNCVHCLAIFDAFLEAGGEYPLDVLKRDKLRQEIEARR